MRDLVSRYDGAGHDPLTRKSDAFSLAQEATSQGPPTTLAKYDDNTPLATAMLEQAAIDPVLLGVGGPDMATERSTIDIDIDGTGEMQVMNLRCHRLAEFVHQHESGLMLDVKIAGKLDGRQPLRRVHQQADCSE